MQGKTPAAPKPTIPRELLEQVDIRVRTIETVEEIEGSDRLVKLVVGLGDHRRAVIVGLKQKRSKRNRGEAGVVRDEHRTEADHG